METPFLSGRAEEGFQGAEIVRKAAPRNCGNRDRQNAGKTLECSSARHFHPFEYSGLTENQDSRGAKGTPDFL